MTAYPHHGSANEMNHSDFSADPSNMPNLLKFIYFDALKSVRPERSKYLAGKPYDHRTQSANYRRSSRIICLRNGAASFLDFPLRGTGNQGI